MQNLYTHYYQVIFSYIIILLKLITLDVAVATVHP